MRRRQAAGQGVHNGRNCVLCFFVFLLLAPLFALLTSNIQRLSPTMSTPHFYCSSEINFPPFFLHQETPQKHTLTNATLKTEGPYVETNEASELRQVFARRLSTVIGKTQRGCTSGAFVLSLIQLLGV